MFKPQRTSGVHLSHTTWSSPTVSLEKGAYRIRSNPTRLFTESAPTLEPRRRPGTRDNFYLTVLVCLLASACLACFGSAYYLFSTRWEVQLGSVPHRTDPELQVVGFNGKPLASPPDERFLSYLPHSGFHNQRIAFENALTLARLTNRTLLVPPVRLGDDPIHYYKFDTLNLIYSEPEILLHCPQTVLDPPFLPGCIDARRQTMVPWDLIVDLTSLRSQQRLVMRWNMSQPWVREELGIPDSDILTIKDRTVYHFRFLDTIAGESPSHQKYKKDIQISDLARAPQRLIQLGTLFGSSRLRLRINHNKEARQKIRRSMSFTNPLFLQVVGAINVFFSQQYLSAHVRVKDGQFRSQSARNVRQVWHKLVNQVTNASVEDVTTMEASVWDVPRLPSLSFASGGLEPSSCRGRRYDTPGLSAFNIPLYISTDVDDPDTHPVFKPFIRTFPCTYFLGDFSHHTKRLDVLRNGIDGLELKEFLLPFIDAMVAGHAASFAGTPGSTYSGFIEDVLWPTYHGQRIGQRG